MKRSPLTTILFALFFLTWLLAASPLEAQTPPPCERLFVRGNPDFEAIDCESPPISHTFTGANIIGTVYPDYTVTYDGGHFVDFGYLTSDLSAICGNSGLFEPHLDIHFSHPASEVSVELYNWLFEPMTYTITDNLGRSSKVTIQSRGFFPAGPLSVSILGAGITSARITPDSMGSDSSRRWAFSLSSVHWNPETPSCQCAAPPKPGPHHVSGYNWGMDVEVSADDGLVLRNVMLGERYMAKEISVPYYVLRTSALLATRAELKPSSTDGEARSRLVDYREVVDDEKLVLYAVYSVDRIPAGSSSCLTITQRYEFHKAGTGCEPSETLPCSPFKPIVEYKFYGQGGETLQTIDVAQRLEFWPDGIPGNTITLGRDCESFDDGGLFEGTPAEPCRYTCLNLTDPGFVCLQPNPDPNIIIPLSPFFPGIALKRNQDPLISETSDRAIVNGAKGDWDNLHMTGKSFVDLPVPTPPGCPECVHMHWRWAKFFRPRPLFPPFDFGSQFGLGRPLVPAGSNQDVRVLLVRANENEKDPTVATGLSNNEPLLPFVAMWYLSTGFQVQDSFFTHGGFFNPAVRNATAHSGPVTVTYFNLFEASSLAVNSIDPATAGVLPDGYAVYNNLAYDITTEAEVSGPHTVSINVSSATDPIVFSSLRILHGEKDPNDPTRVILVDRTILPPDQMASNFDTKVISARVDSLSPFVIARLSDISPPISIATISPAPNADGWNNTDVTVTLEATDSSAVRQITYTSALTGVTTTVLSATATVPITIDGGNEIIYYGTDKFGNVEEPKSVFVSLDKSPPFFLFIGTPSPEPNSAGWNNSDVSINYAVDDNDGSGVFPSQGTLVLANEGAAVTGTITATDRAGNSASQTTVPVKMDKTNPVTTHNVSLNGTQAMVTLSAADNLSGVAATSYTINGGTAQSYSAPFTLSGAGVYTINYYSTDVADNTEATKTTSFTIASAPTTVTLVAIKDSFVRDGADDTNEGANERLRIQSSGHNRVLVAFDLSNISTANLVSATLVMSIGENSDNWGANGQLVDVQRLLVDWTQGNGRNDVMVGGGSGFRGTGEGVTWNCAKDSDISNQKADCGAKWNGGSFAAATAPGALHTNGLLGEVRWDVTSDVRSGAGSGWLIKKRSEGQPGQVRYFSLEGAAANQTVAPRLVLSYSQ